MDTARFHRFRPSVILAAFAVVFGGAFVLWPGVRRQRITPAAATISPRHAAGARPGVQDSPEYRLAAADFTRNDIVGALRRVDALLARTDLTASDCNFLQRQAATCQARLSGKLLAMPRPVLAPAPHSASLTAAQADCGPRALFIACRQMNVPASLPALRRAAGTTGNGINLAGLITAAKTVGLTAKGVQMDGPALANLDSHSEPAIAWVDGAHYLTVLSVHGDSATVRDPGHSGDEEIALTSGPTSLLARSGGILLLLSPGASKAGNPAAGI